jgi:hypothetical protein
MLEKTNEDEINEAKQKRIDQIIDLIQTPPEGVRFDELYIAVWNILTHSAFGRNATKMIVTMIETFNILVDNELDIEKLINQTIH